MFQKQLMKGTKIFLKKKNKRSVSMVVNKYKTFIKDEKQCLVECMNNYSIKY